MNIKMEKVSIDDGKDIYNFLSSLGEKENGFNFVPPKSMCDFKMLINKYLDSEITNNPNKVPQFIYWMYDGNTIVGMIKIRRKLNETLLENGGNMGYTISPLYRGKGYGTKIIKEGIKILSKENLSRILITVFDDNSPSKKAIINNGGILKETSGNICKYWISI